RRDQPNDIKFARELANVLFTLGCSIGSPDRPSLGDRPAAVPWLRESIDVARELVRRDPRSTREALELSLSEGELGAVLGSDAPAEALALVDDAIGLLARLPPGALADENIRSTLAGEHASRAALAARLGRREEAWRSLEQALRFHIGSDSDV